MKKLIKVGMLAAVVTGIAGLGLSVSSAADSSCGRCCKNTCSACAKCADGKCASCCKSCCK